jgi:hypothetical protein
VTIHSITKVLSLPLIFILAVMLYNGWSSGNQLSVYLIIPVALLVALYTFHGVIDHWWLTKFPVPFDPKLKDWLTKHFPPYVVLDDELKKKFEFRLGLYLNGRLFQSVGKEMRDVPEDIKCMVAAHAVNMTLGIDDYLIGDTDRIFLYKHPFPTPKFPFLHNVETDTEDGVIILSLEQLINAIIRPDLYYNTAYHAYAEAIMFVNNKTEFPSFPEQTWSDIQNISGWNNETICRQTGYQSVPLQTVHSTIFFTMPQKYKMILPEYYDGLSLAFNRKP